MATQTISFKKLGSSGTMSASGLTKGCAYFVPKTGLIHIATSETKYDTFGPVITIKETNGTELATIEMGDTTYSLKYNTSNLATKDDIAILDDFNADITDLYNNKQDASTAITTSNIGSQSVNYANSADSCNYAASVPWTGVTDRPTSLSQFTDDVVAGKYLPLSGGTVTSEHSCPLNINYTGGGFYTYITFYNNGTQWGGLGMQNDKPVFINAANNNMSTLLHEGNYAAQIGNYYLKSSGGTVNGTLRIGKTSADAGTGKTRIYFGDGDFVWIGEYNPESGDHEDDHDDYMTIYGSHGVYVTDDSGEWMRITPSCISSSADTSLGYSTKRFSNGYFSGKLYAAQGFFEESDERLKNFEGKINIDLDKLSKLKKNYFTWKNDSNTKQLGVSAQEIMELYPEIVSETEDGILNVAYEKLSVIALAAVDELYEQNKDLKSKLESLEERLNKLESLLK